MAESILIIGAGIAGLATGCYARMNEYKTTILEMHDKPGGLCTSWQRKGYIFDGCIHNLAGTGAVSRLHRLWEELGAARSWEIIDREVFTRIEGPDGRALDFYTDLDRLERHLKELSPMDSARIDAYIKAARRFAGIDLLGMLMADPSDILRMLPRLPVLIKWMGVSLGKFGAGFRDPFLKRAFPCVQYDMPDIPVAVSLAFLAGMHRGDLGWPAGGSLAFARSIAGRYAELGGEIHFNARVEKILVENGRAIGARLADGREYRADIIISAADGHATIYSMLDGCFINDRIARYYAKPPQRVPMGLQICIGAARDLSGEPPAIVLLLDEPIVIAGEEHRKVDLENFSFDPAMAPPGKAALKVMFETGYDYWRELYGRDRPGYEAEKKRAAETVIGVLDRRFPGLRAQIETVEVATPVTTERFTGNWRGLQAYAASRWESLFGGGISKTLPGLSNFYMAGQWAGATVGISTVAAMGRKLVQEICRKDGRKFRTQTAIPSAPRS